MTNLLLAIALLLGLVAVALLVLLLRRDGRTPVLERLERAQERSERSLREEFARNREEFGAALKGSGDTLNRQLAALVQMNDQRLERIREVLEARLRQLQEDNAGKLEQMRATVEEKLQGTLEKRLGESFQLVSQRLEQVYRGLGEMQALAAGVGDLKRVLTNVKTRGTWGEVQLGLLLEQVLAPDQYGANVATKGGNERVEFAVKLPGQADDARVWLPIDSKFPVEDWQRMQEAQDRCDPDAVEAAARQLEVRIKQCARDIRDKYLDPPRTTDFGILFLPTEGLFAEVLRRPGLPDQLQQDFRVVVAGPTTLWSLLNSLQMGFRTLAIQQRSSEVWNLLAAVKTEWAKYGEVLDKVQKQIHQAADTLEKVQVRNRAIGRKLKDVQALPRDEAQAALALENGDEPEDTGNRE